MSDSKWRRLFASLRNCGVRSIRWKFVRDDRILESGVPAEVDLLEHGLADILPDPYGAYREIEWVEIDAPEPQALVAVLQGVAQFPVEVQPEGIRVAGYSW